MVEKCGIFENIEEKASGDPDAVEDFEKEAFVSPISFKMFDDGLPIPEIENEYDLSNAATPVNVHNFKCSAGPCKFYTENVRVIVSGPDPDAEDMLEVGRWCGRIRTWAEQTDLRELEVYGCTAYTPMSLSTFSEIVAYAIADNVKEVVKVRSAAEKAGLDLGICVRGPCKYFVEIVCRYPSREEKECLRFCTRLAGLGRLCRVDEEPVAACSAWSPIAESENLSEYSMKNLKILAESKKSFEQREEKNRKTGD